MKIKKIHGHGNHFILDGTSEADLADVEFIKEFLLKIVDEVKMKSISQPLVLYHEAEDGVESGVTGTIILAESNVTIHTYPKKKFFFLDVFSCKEFEIENLVDFLVDEFEITDYKLKILKRGFYG